MKMVLIGHQATKEGAGRFLLDQVDYLLAHGVELFAVLPSEGPLTVALKNRGVETKVVSFPWWIKTAVPEGAPDFAAIVSAAYRIAALVRLWHATIVYTHTVVIPSGPLAAALAGVPHVWHMHEFSHNSDGVEVVIPRVELARFANLTSNLVVFNSQAVAREWDGLLPPGKTTLVYNWVNFGAEVGNDLLPDVSPAIVQGLAGRFVIMQLGSVIPLKRQADAIQAVALLVAEGREVALLIVGPVLDKGYHQQLIGMVRERRLHGRVHFVPFVEKTEAFFKVAQATVVCCPVESFGRVTIESMAQGVPVIGADGGGTAEIIQDGVNGLLYPPKDAAALASRLRQLIDDEEFRLRLGANARRRAADYGSADKQMEPLLARLKELEGTTNPMSPVGESFLPLLTSLMQHDARTMPYKHLLKVAAVRILRLLGVGRLLRRLGFSFNRRAAQSI